MNMTNKRIMNNIQNMNQNIKRMKLDMEVDDELVEVIVKGPQPPQVPKIPKINDNFITTVPCFNIQLANQSFRVLQITDLRSFNHGLEIILESKFLDDFFKNFYAFVIILKCGFGGQLLDFERLNNSHPKRPLVIIFECDVDRQVFYRNGIPGEDLQQYFLTHPKTTFDKLLSWLKHPNYKNFLDIELPEDFRKNLNDAAKNSDYLSLRFLYLFNNKMRPQNNEVMTVLNKDIDEISLKGLTTVFDFGFIENNEEELIYDLPSISSSQNDLQYLLHHVRDKKNLLIHAIECNNQSAAELLIKCGIDVNWLNSDYKRAIDYAFDNQKYKFMLLLLKANSLNAIKHFGEEFKDKQDKQDLKDLQELNKMIENTKKLHNLVYRINDYNKRDTRLKEIDEILKNHRYLKHFYNYENISIMTVALKYKKINTYEHLLKQDIFIGVNETFERLMHDPKDSLLEHDQHQGLNYQNPNFQAPNHQAFGHLSQAQREKVRLAHVNCAKPLPGHYLTILMANTLLAPDNTPDKDKMEKLEKIYKKLDKNDFIRPLLRVVAASRNFKIIFDFKRDTVDFANPTATQHDFGLFDSKGFHIYIGAKKLERDATNDEAMAIVAHEIAHYAILLIYENFCAPFCKTEGKRRDRELLGNETEYLEIAKKYWDERMDQNIVLGYHEIIQYALQYTRKDQEGIFLAELIVRPAHLFIHLKSSKEELKHEKLVHKDLFDYFEKTVLKDAEKSEGNIAKKYIKGLELAHQVRCRKRRNIKIMHFASYSTLFLLIAALISTFFYFIDPCKVNFLSTSECTFENLFWWTRSKIEGREMYLQGYKTTVAAVTGLNRAVLNSFSPESLTHFASISVGVGLAVSNYFPRLLTFIDKSFMSGPQKWRKDDTFDFDTIRDNFIMKNGKFGILTGEAPKSGTSTELRAIGVRYKEKFPERFVALIDLKTLHEDQLKTWKITDRKTLIEFMVMVMGLDDSKDDGRPGGSKAAEKSIFEYQLDIGKAILLIDEVDLVYPYAQDLMLNFTRLTLENFYNKTEIWFASRLPAESVLKKVIETTNFTIGYHNTFKLVSLISDDRIDFFNHLIKHKISTLGDEQREKWEKIVKNSTLSNEKESKIMKILKNQKNLTLTENRQEMMKNLSESQNLTIDELMFENLKKFVSQIERWRSQSFCKITIAGLIEIMLDETIDHHDNPDFVAVLKNFISKIRFKLKGDFEPLQYAIQEESDLLPEIKKLKKISILIVQKESQSNFLSINFEDILDKMEPKELNFSSESWDNSVSLLTSTIQSGLLSYDDQKELKFIHRLVFEYFLALFVKEDIYDIYIGKTEKTENLKNKIKLLLNLYRDLHNKYSMVTAIVEMSIDNEKKNNFSEHFQNVTIEALEEFENSKTGILDIRNDLKRGFFKNDKVMHDKLDQSGRMRELKLKTTVTTSILN